MRFRLTYRGPLMSTQRRGKRGPGSALTEQKQELRRAFDPQLRTLWGTRNFLKKGGMEGGDFLELSGDARDENPLDNDYLSNKHHQGDWKFIPLVTKELELNCSIDVLFLRPDRPVDVVWGGDIDNRIKTLIDSLKVPDVNDGYNEIKPDSSDPRLFCLLEDDNLVTELRIRTDQLLEPLSSNEEKTGTFLVITVDISPYNATWSNVGFS